MIKDLLSAFALMLVLEGITPFLSPRRMRKMIFQVATLNDKTLRLAGLAAMVLGVVLLYVSRHG